MRRPQPRLLWRRLRPATMRMRLTLLTAVITVLPLTACAVSVGVTVRTTLLQEALDKTIGLSPPGGYSPGDFKPCTRHPVLDMNEGEHRFTICLAAGDTDEGLEPSLSLAPWTDTRASPPLRAHFDTTAEGQAEVVHSLETYQARLNTLMWSMTGGALGITLLIAASTWIAAGRILRPVEAIRAEFADLSAHHLDRRVPVPRAGNEIALLARTMNTTLDRLQTAVERQRQFVADASHELRTPLACLRTELELALNRSEAADWPQVVHDAHEDTKRLQDLTEDLLLLARLDADHTDRRRDRSVDLTDLVRDETARRRPPRGLTVHVHTDPGPVAVQGHPMLLARVLGNLLDNAERHATSTITVRLTHDPDRREAAVEIQDDGSGIPPEEHERIFERFTRLDDARTRDAGGSGLGLAIAHRIATTHQGTLTLTPGAGGAHFVLRLPARTA
ncbi:HAMP domain-containing sensor histidine kinase [Streptomyces sp. NPDC050803]|uniref:sensor histidine kinase n=1 Tax=unclassified Streptomyces TaxID=2593676 RepID=UPI0034149827